LALLEVFALLYQRVAASKHLPVDSRGTEVRLGRYWGDERAAYVDETLLATGHKHTGTSRDNHQRRRHLAVLRGNWF